MDHKLKDQKKKLKPGCIISLLILVILILGIVAFGYRSAQTVQKAQLEKIQNQMKYDTTFIRNGPMDVVIENLSGKVQSERFVELNWEASGTVASVDVNIGDQVKTDQVLAKLDPKTLNTEVMNAETELKNANDALKDLQNVDQLVSKALSEMVQAQKDYEDAQTAYNSLDPSRASEDQVKIAYEAYLKAQNDYDSARAKFEVTRDYALNDPTRIKRLGDVGGYRSVRDNALAAYYQYLGQGTELERALREAKVQLTQATFEQKQFEYNQALKGRTEAEINTALAKIAAAQKKINASSLIAPFDGQVTKLDAKPNDIIVLDDATGRSSSVAVRIDDFSTLSINTTVSEMDVNHIKPGQEVAITFIAIPDKKYKGTVTHIANSGKTEESSVTFGITVKIDDPDAAVKPGMTAEMTMKVASIPSALSVPVTAIDVQDGKKYVRVKQADDSFLPVEVETGLISGMMVQILTDKLSEKDEVQSNIHQTFDPDKIVEPEPETMIL